MSGAMNQSHCIPGLTMSTALTGNFSAGGVRECTPFSSSKFSRTRIALCQRPGADTEETGRYDLKRVERFV